MFFLAVMMVEAHNSVLAYTYIPVVQVTALSKYLRSSKFLDVFESSPSRCKVCECFQPVDRKVMKSIVLFNVTPSLNLQTRCHIPQDSICSQLPL